MCIGGPAPTSVFREPAKLYRQACHQAGKPSYLGWVKAIYIAEDDQTALREAEQPVRNFIDFNVSPMDSLARSTPAERQRLIDAGYAFYAADDFPNLRNLSYEELVAAGIVCVGSSDTVGKQLLALWKEFRFDENDI